MSGACYANARSGWYGEHRSSLDPFTKIRVIRHEFGYMRHMFRNAEFWVLFGEETCHLRTRTVCLLYFQK